MDLSLAGAFEGAPAESRPAESSRLPAALPDSLRPCALVC